MPATTRPLGVRYPNCQTDNRIFFSRLRGREFLCSGCGATLKVHRRNRIVIILGILSILVDIPVIYVVAEFAGVPPDKIWVMKGSELPLIPALAMIFGFIVAMLLVSIGIYRIKLEVIRLRPVCGNCGSTIIIDGAKFCPRCEANLATAAADVSPRATNVQTSQEARLPRVAESTGICMVCNQDLRLSDAVAWCSHCGSPAHRDHLLEYLHVHNQCPACSKHLDEKELSEQLSRATKQSRGRKNGREET
ncbi:MAG: hypothetical protein WED05_08810 [Candidatus Atabeyarchaeum deiterrae]